jgi:NAD(P)H-dependent FMN reductase
MILVISGTNRPNSNTRILADYVYTFLREKDGVEAKFLSLEDLPSDVLNNEMYHSGILPESLVAIQEEMVIPSDKWIIISPEYNGSIPGVLKLFIDVISIRKYSDNFKGKKAALIGVSTGRAGNLRGMEHLTGMLNYLKMHVHPEKLPVSSVQNLIDDELKIDLLTCENLERLVTEFIN